MAMLTFRSTHASAASASATDGNPSGLVRIENVELFFDVMSVMQQIHQARGRRRRFDRCPFYSHSLDKAHFLPCLRALTPYAISFSLLQAQFSGLNRAVVPNTVAMLGLVSEPHIVFAVDDRVFPISRYYHVRTTSFQSPRCQN